MNEEELDSGDKYKQFSKYFRFRSVLGQGNFGVVVAAVYRRTKEECAVKVE